MNFRERIVGALSLDSGHDVAVHAHPGGEHRPAFAAVHQADAPPGLATAVGGQQVDELIRGLDGVRADPDADLGAFRAARTAVHGSGFSVIS